MNQAQLAQIVATVAAVMAQGSKKSSHKAVSTYKAANKFTPKGKISSDGKTKRQLGKTPSRTKIEYNPTQPIKLPSFV